MADEEAFFVVVGVDEPAGDTIGAVADDFAGLRVEVAINMAIATPKKKQELERQFKINPEVNTRLEAFMKAEPGLVQFVKELPREQLERKFLLRKMQDEEQKQGYSAKVKAWLEKPGSLSRRTW